MSDKEMSDSEAPEEFTVHQGMQQDEEIRKVQRENKARVVREGKERRREWAKKLTPKSLPKEKSTIDKTENETETNIDSQGNNVMLPDDIVELLAAREKKVFTSESEEEEVEKRSSSKRRKLKRSGLLPVILNEIPPAKCVQSSMEFLNKRRMRVSRSSAVLKNANQSLRLISKSGLLS